MLGVKLRTVVSWYLVAIVAISAFPGGPFQAQEAPQLPSPPQMTADAGFGFGGHSHFGVIDQTGVMGFAQAGHHLGALDLWSGGILEEPHLASGYDIAAQTELIQTGQMALDLAELQRKAEEEKRRRAAQAGVSGLAFERRRGVGYPEPWELKNFSTCGGSGNARYQARIEVVDAYEIMCRAAERDGVPLRIVSAYRSIEHQTRLWNQKLKETGGDEKAAAKWVARPGRSNHQRGIAIDLAIITGDPKAKAWIHKIVGCYSKQNGLDMARTSCGSGERPVKQVQLYGFVLPMDWEPWHIELGIPIGPAPTTCAPGQDRSVPEIIASVWRCRLQDEGWKKADVDRVTAEALVIAKCESSFIPTAVAFGGKYVNKPKPDTGLRYTARGVFQFIKASADTWIAGGYENADDPVANSDGAVRYYLAEKAAGREGWGPWECRTHLPQYGGPPLPDWAKQY